MCGRAPLTSDGAELSCPNGHRFPLIAGSSVPVFDTVADDANEYAQEGAAEKHDNALRWVLATFRTDESTLREDLVGRLLLRKGDRVLVTGVGAGNDLPYVARGLMGRGQIYAQDAARSMLVSAVERHAATVAGAGVSLNFSIGDATHLPFADQYFDAAYHFGGVNLFSDVTRGIAEMNRVVKTGGRVVIGDEGLAPWLRRSELGRMLIRNNALYGCDAPIDCLPQGVRSPRLSWVLCNTFYVIDFSACQDPLPIDIDVPHVGTRGGTIRTRYHGQLEGVDPDLRDRVYAEARRLGRSRVEFLESLFRRALAEPDR
jgi:SAM-dependent methyltransferase